MMITAEELSGSYRLSDTSSIYDVFAEAAGNLQAAYVAAKRAATSVSEQNLWLDRGIALHKFRRAVDPDDRAALINAIALFGAERVQVRAFVDARATFTAA